MQERNEVPAWMGDCLLDVEWELERGRWERWERFGEGSNEA